MEVPSAGPIGTGCQSPSGWLSATLLKSPLVADAHALLFWGAAVSPEGRSLTSDMPCAGEAGMDGLAPRLFSTQTDMGNGGLHFLRGDRPAC